MDPGPSMRSSFEGHVVTGSPLRDLGGDRGGVPQPSPPRLGRPAAPAMEPVVNEETFMDLGFSAAAPAGAAQGTFRAPAASFGAPAPHPASPAGSRSSMDEARCRLDVAASPGGSAAPRWSGTAALGPLGANGRAKSPGRGPTSPRRLWAAQAAPLGPRGDREVAFLQLNSFLLRSHAKSLVSALTMEGWLEAWEGERLRHRFSDEAPEIAKGFVSTYLRFVETEDVPDFVRRLRLTL